MNVIFYPSDRDQLLLFIAEDSADVLEKFFLPSWLDQSGALLDGEDRLNVDLGVSVCHTVEIAIQLPPRLK